RLDAPPADARWRPAERMPSANERAVALSAIMDVLRPEGELRGETCHRLNQLRARLGEIGYLIDRRTLDELWLCCAALERGERLSAMEVLDRALAARALPAMLAAMDLGQLTRLPEMLGDMPVCMKLMEQPLPLPPL
ncbi:MAG: hypothetical protein VB065_04775, partial [Eubacteriales bacterium]|nr:hypothetical protein [Eubacteriales bacterium]